MTSNLSVKTLATVVFSTMMITACGGGGEGGDASSAPTNSSPIITSPPIITEPSPTPTEPPVNNGNTGTAPPDNNAQAALAVNNQISLARLSCGLNGLTADPALESVAIKHANYTKYVFANSTPTTFNAHVENKISDIANVTGNSNPFFTGETFSNRLANANYANANNGATENIAQNYYFNSLGNVVTPEAAASSMTKSLLGAPYHLRSLMLPSSALIGTGVTPYSPFNKDSNKNQGFVLVTHGAATSSTKDKIIEGLFTYPCQGVKDTITALYNESPDPVQGSGRNLQTDPIGQPVYISLPTAKTIKVSNVKFRDVQRNIDVPIQLLDFDNDPYKNTNYGLPSNEAFILPITDNLKSCESGIKKGKNCGLYGNSDYRVSFDVLVDNRNLISKSFTFSTGNVDY